MKKIPFICLALLAISITVSQAGCSKKSDSSVTPPPVTTITCTGINPGFASEVLPLIQTKCATNSGCHAAGSTNSGGPLTTYAQINARSSNIKSQVSSGAMPKSGSLSAAEKNTIVCWVSNGALNN
ncbi:hypothetical protein BH10BAC3_BH10BAC3_39930 [soil metagenome]